MAEKSRTPDGGKVAPQRPAARGSLTRRRSPRQERTTATVPASSPGGATAAPRGDPHRRQAAREKRPGTGKQQVTASMGFYSALGAHVKI